MKDIDNDELRTNRGGAWFNYANGCGLPGYDQDESSDSYDLLGFRPILSMKNAVDDLCALRGASWTHLWWRCRTSTHYEAGSNHHLVNAGFRAALRSLPNELGKSSYELVLQSPTAGTTDSMTVDK